MEEVNPEGTTRRTGEDKGNDTEPGKIHRNLHKRLRTLLGDGKSNFMIWKWTQRDTSKRLAGGYDVQRD